MVSKQNSKECYWEWYDPTSDPNHTVPMDVLERPVLHVAHDETFTRKAPLTSHPSRHRSFFAPLYVFVALVALCAGVSGSIIGVLAAPHIPVSRAKTSTTSSTPAPSPTLTPAKTATVASTPSIPPTPAATATIPFRPLPLPAQWTQAGLNETSVEEARIWASIFVARYQTVDALFPQTLTSSLSWMTEAAQERFLHTDERADSHFLQQLRVHNERRVGVPDTFHVQLVSATTPRQTTLQNGKFFFTWILVPYVLQVQEGADNPTYQQSTHLMAVLLVHTPLLTHGSQDLTWRVSAYVSQYHEGQALPPIPSLP